MRQAKCVTGAGEIVDGEPLEGARLVAVFLWPNPDYPPLLRMNPLHVTLPLRAAVRGWAAAMRAQDRPLAVLRADHFTI